jgi:hypothetical protein
LASNDGSYVASSCGCGGHDPQIFGTDSSFEKKNLFNKYIVDNSSSIFEVFESAATRLRKAYDSRVKRSLLLGFILINLITIEEATKDGFWVLIVGLIALLTTTYWFMLKRSRIKEVYEDFRVVAESKRVEMWLQSAGVDGNVFESMGVKELMDPWLMGILEDVRKWEKLSKASTIPGFAVPIKWSEVTNWLDDQIDYLDGTEERQGAIGRNLRQAERYDFVAKISIVSGMSLYFLSKGLNGFFADSGSFVYQGVLELVFSLALSISAFSLALSQLMGHKEIAARYGASLRVLKNGAIELANASNSGDLAKAQAIVKEIGLESLQETLYWFTVRRTRDVRPL